MIAYDNSTEGGKITNTSLTYSHTVGSITNGLLLVGVKTETGSDYITGITYNGVSMTQLKKFISGASEYYYVYGLLNPTTGSHSVVVSSSNSVQIASEAESLSGVLQSGLPDSSNTNTSSTNNITLSTTVVAGSCWLFSISGGDDGGQTISGSTGTNLRQTSNACIAIGDSNGTVGTRSQSMQWTAGSPINWGGIIISIAPTVGVTTQTPLRSLMGVGN